MLARRELGAAAATSGSTVSPQVQGQWRLALERAVLWAVADNMVRSTGAADRHYWPTARQQREQHTAAG